MIKVVYINEKPSGDILFCSCDSLYFQDHAIPLIASADAANNDIHVHVVNPINHVFKEYEKLSDWVENIKLTFSYEQTDLSLVDPRGYYAANRFMIAEDILIHANRLLVIDTDCLIMQHIDFPDKELGLYLRDSNRGTVGWTQLGTKVAAGIVLLSQESAGYITKVGNRIRSYGYRWFVDQVALYEQYIEDGWDRSDRFINFSDTDMDWNFREGSTIWTGKGDRKYDNTVYVKKKIEFHKYYHRSRRILRAFRSALSRVSPGPSRARGAHGSRDARCRS